MSTPSGETTPAPGQAASAPSIEEAAEPLFNIHTKGGVKGHENPHLSRCEHCAELIAYGHAVLEEAWAAFWAATDEQAELDALRDRIDALGRS